MSDRAQEYAAHAIIKCAEWAGFTAEELLGDGREYNFQPEARDALHKGRKRLVYDLMSNLFYLPEEDHIVHWDEIRAEGFVLILEGPIDYRDVAQLTGTRPEIWLRYLTNGEVSANMN